MGLIITQLYLRNTSNLHYEKAAKIYKLHVKRQAVLQGTVQDGTDCDRLVVKRSEADRVFLECNLTVGVHRGRDATIWKVKKDIIGQFFTNKSRKRYTYN